jgi:pimeloyl-ACP methyl ester carboxylesterase
LKYVLVHGAWHGSWAWGLVIGPLRALGHDVIAVDLPSSGPTISELGDFTADCATVQGALDRLDGDAIVVGHSYGGQVISQATAGRPDVSHLVYVCAFMCDVGQSPTDINEGLPPTWIEIAGDGLAARVTTARETFFHDVDPQLAAQSQDRLQLQSLTAASTPLSAAGWHDIDSTYIICEDDRAIPVDRQQQMSRHASNTRRLNSSHSPFLSMPDAVIDILTSLADATAASSGRMS